MNKTMPQIKFWIFLFALCTSNAVNAQFLSPQITNSYTPSVITKVFDVCVTTAITQYERQMTLAKFFNKQDSIIASAILKASQVNSIKELIDSLNIVFEKLLSSQELLRYNTKRYKPFVEFDAKSYALVANKKYEADTILQKTIYQTALAKNAYTVKALSTVNGNKSFTDTIFIFYSKYDSAFNGYQILAKGQAYLREKIEMLNKTNPLALSQRDEIVKSYTNLCLTQSNNYFKNFITAVKWHVNNELYLKEIFNDSINNSALEKTKSEIEDYSYQYGLSTNMQKRIAPYVNEKVKRVAFLDITQSHSRSRDSLYREAKECTWIKVKNLLLRYGYYRGEENRFVNALGYQKTLKLSSPQLDSLVKWNEYVDSVIYNTKIHNQGAMPDMSNYFSIKLKEVCTTGQYDTLLSLEAKPQALYNTNETWSEIKKLKLITDADTAATFQSILNYNIALLKLKERYRFNKSQYNSASTILSKNKPPVLKKLEAATLFNEEFDNNTLKQ